jgi:hypothetical protein
VDWDRQAFTMDANLSRAVLEAFVRFHKVCSGLCLPYDGNSHKLAKQTVLNAHFRASVFHICFL